MTRRKPEPTVKEENGRLALNKLSKSSASLAADCLFAFYLKYVMGIPRPTDFTLFRGNVGHDALEYNNKEFITKGKYLTEIEIKDYCVDEAWDKQLQFALEDGDIDWTLDEAPLDKPKRERERYKLGGQVGDYRKERADLFAPSASEERFELSPEDIAIVLDDPGMQFSKWYVEGYIDVITQLEGQNGHDIVMDYKFSGSKLTQPAKEELLTMQHPSIEPALYQVGARSRGIEPGGFQYERLVRNKKGFSYDPFSFAVPSSAEKGALRWLRDVSNMIQALLDALNGTPSVSNHGGFIPRISTYPGERWKCRRCEYGEICMKELSKL